MNLYFFKLHLNVVLNIGFIFKKFLSLKIKKCFKKVKENPGKKEDKINFMSNRIFETDPNNFSFFFFIFAKKFALV